jgi:antitoxin component HigA of HigAB toxin-antitoxin module
MSPRVAPILSDEDLCAAVDEVERLWGAPIGTPAGKRLDELVTRIEAYEALKELITRRHSDEKA